MREGKCAGMGTSFLAPRYSLPFKGTGGSIRITKIFLSKAQCNAGTSYTRYRVPLKSEKKKILNTRDVKV